LRIRIKHLNPGLNSDAGQYSAPLSIPSSRSQYSSWPWYIISAILNCQSIFSLCADIRHRNALPGARIEERFFFRTTQKDKTRAEAIFPGRNVLFQKQSFAVAALKLNVVLERLGSCAVKGEEAEHRHDHHE
jgi:hypothetical protein